MCGIAGLFDPGRRAAPDALAAAARAMADALRHRGPDGEGFWSDPARGVALAHRRLAIIEVSRDADQPMASPGGRYVAVFNGEIYNYRALGAELAEAGLVFDARSDTRVLLAGIEHWGLEAALRRAIGMFAFALYDRATGALHLIRDRLGVKPLAFGTLGGIAVFGSELGAIAAAASRLGTGLRAVDPVALAHYAAYGHVAEGTTIRQGLAKVSPGEIVTIDQTGAVTARAYWTIAEAREAAPCALAPEAADAALEACLADAVAHRLVADVPVGVFLSGGIDSSLVTALMQARRRAEGSNARSFTVGFEDMGLNEAPQARAVARHLGTDHVETMVDARAALDVVPRLGRVFDEPFADASAIPMHVIAGIARASVTVALSGDGGDEGFGGYARHILADGLERRLRPLPGPVPRLAGLALGLLSPDVAEGVLSALRPILPQALGRRLSPTRLAGLAGFLRGGDPALLYDAMTRQWADPAAILADKGARAPRRHLPPPTRADDSLAGRMMAADAATYLPGDILVKVDRATMAHGLEAREPLLDHRLLALAWSLPPAARFDRGRGKRPLARILARHVPPALTERPKQGFTVPMADWLRGPLRDFATDLLAPARVRATGLLDPYAVTRGLDEHLSGRRDRQHQVWNALMLQAWAEAWD